MAGPSTDTIASRSALHAARRPDHPAIICEGRETTYAELHRASNRTAHALLAAGVSRGDRVAFLGRENEHYYDLALGCAKTGVVLVPINWRLTAGEVDHILRDSGACLAFVQGEFLPAVERVRGSLPQLRQVRRFDGAGHRAEGFLSWKGDAPDTDVDVPIGPQDPMVQMYTSGTSGLPKGVVLAHRTFFSFIEHMRQADCDWIDWRPQDRTLICFPGLHSGGMAWFMHAFNVGATSVVMEMFVAEEAVRLIPAHKITTVWAAPAMLDMMMAEHHAGPETFASLRKVVYGGAPISPAQLERCLSVFACELAQMYAAAETGSVVTCLSPEDHVPGNPRLTSAGRVCPGNVVRIVDEDGNEQPAGTIGQVCVWTPAHFVEYFRQPEVTARTLADGWLKLGDAGYLDEEGYLFLCDRINDTIIVAGQNIYPVEVENALRAHPAVVDVAVVGVPDARWGETVRACVVTAPGSETTGRELLLFLRGRLADFKIPTSYEFLEALPRNPTGKVLRRELRERIATAAAVSG
ncbi:long-chain-fatty-acid--CoA ligase (plasmid) [Streptomyces sp. FXJ1.172]|uniref:long-chain-fatty-acid--CoA ligase n=1 Tax=Streptomyces sp. FXJ1.172 TaxID=710705 RepID=UPI0023DD355C|nr:long-chain-fatty-acid--CoA ligase [Streptomyces sp. FXJ1.172]WEP01068.1 long-chain-fatty-acid--CoA ligase [Streptomyces sp. FXJ1.172]